MVSIIKTTGNTSTGLHMVQRSGNKFKFRCCVDSIKRLVSVPVKPEHMHYFTTRKDGVFHSDLYDRPEQCADELIQFIFKCTGIKCSRE